MDIIVKKARLQDLDAVAELYAAVCDYLQNKPFNPNWRRDIYPAREDAEQYLAADSLYIAWKGGTAAGTIALTQGAEDIFYIHEAAVHPAHLRQGIGKVLLAHAAQEAAARGAKAIRLHVWTGNTPAIGTYENNGYVRLKKEDIGLGEYGLDWFYLYEKRL